MLSSSIKLKAANFLKNEKIFSLVWLLSFIIVCLHYPLFGEIFAEQMLYYSHIFEQPLSLESFIETSSYIALFPNLLALLFKASHLPIKYFSLFQNIISLLFLSGCTASICLKFFRNFIASDLARLLIAISFCLFHNYDLLTPVNAAYFGAIPLFLSLICFEKLPEISNTKSFFLSLFLVLICLSKAIFIMALPAILFVMLWAIFYRKPKLLAIFLPVFCAILFQVFIALTLHHNRNEPLSISYIVNFINNFHFIASINPTTKPEILSFGFIHHFYATTLGNVFGIFVGKNLMNDLPAPKNLNEIIFCGLLAVTIFCSFLWLFRRTIGIKQNHISQTELWKKNRLIAWQFFLLFCGGAMINYIAGIDIKTPNAADFEMAKMASRQLISISILSFLLFCKIYDYCFADSKFKITIFVIILLQTFPFGLQKPTSYPITPSESFSNWKAFSELEKEENFCIPGIPYGWYIHRCSMIGKFAAVEDLKMKNFSTIENGSTITLDVREVTNAEISYVISSFNQSNLGDCAIKINAFDENNNQLGQACSLAQNNNKFFTFFYFRKPLKNIHHIQINHDEKDLKISLSKEGTPILMWLSKVNSN